MDARLILSLDIPVDVNRAGPKELATLPGVGPALARRILAHRQRRGPYHRRHELLEVRGIGPGKLRRMKSRLLIRPEPHAALIDPWENKDFPAKMGSEADSQRLSGPK